MSGRITDDPKLPDIFGEQYRKRNAIAVLVQAWADCSSGDEDRCESSRAEYLSLIVANVKGAIEPSTGIRKLWHAFFTWVLKTPNHDDQLAFLVALHEQPPTELANKAPPYNGEMKWSNLPRFAKEWKFTQSIITPKRSIPGWEYPVAFLHFVTFSARWLGETQKRQWCWPHHPMTMCPANVLIACKGSLETQSFMNRERALDVCAAALWLKYGAKAL